MKSQCLFATALLSALICIVASGAAQAPQQSSDPMKAENDAAPTAIPAATTKPSGKSLPEKSSPTHFDPTDAYEVQHVEGWQVLVNKKFPPQEPDLYKQTMAELSHQFYAITRKVPAEPLAKLRKIKIWVEYDEPHTKIMCYHPRESAVAWLKGNGMNPEKAGCVELANAKNFVTWTLEQPWMVLHEFSHGYHDQFLPDGFENAEVAATYHMGMDQKLYDSVLRRGFKTEKAYAATNQMEYFAETSEAYFGTNDFYPFVNVELRQHDPHGYDLMKKMWGADL